MVGASLPGASPKLHGSSVATPLERSLGRIAGVNEMTSTARSVVRIILQFNFDRDINGAARDITGSHIGARKACLPGGMPSRPTLSQGQPSDAPL